MWAAPAVVVAASAPAIAASPVPTVTGSVCELERGDGNEIFTAHKIHIGFTSTGSFIPKGTKVKIRVAIMHADNYRPEARRDVGTSSWKFNFASQPLQHYWEYEFEATANISPVDACNGPILYWSDANALKNNFAGDKSLWPSNCDDETIMCSYDRNNPRVSSSQLDVEVFTAQPGGSYPAMGAKVSYTVPRRAENTVVNMAHAMPMLYLSKNATQSSWPAVTYKYKSPTDHTYNGRTIQNNVVTYPAGVTPASGRCTWSDATATCPTAANGQSTPGLYYPPAGQNTVIPAL